MRVINPILLPLFFLFSGLTELPPLPPSSPLKALWAGNCSLKTIHESFFRTGLSLDLKNNEITELPRKETLGYLGDGGEFKAVYETVGIDLRYNPLKYPPRHVYDEGKAALLAYFKTNGNSMISANDHNILLIGNQEVGKTSLGQALARKINTAEDIRHRTQAFDVYHTQFKGKKLHIHDVGGQKEYESSITVLCRNNGLKICVLNPKHLLNEKEFEGASWSWVEKVLSEADNPHFMFVVNKIDHMKEGEDKPFLKEKLIRLVLANIAKVQEGREKQLEQVNRELKATENALKNCESDSERKALEERKATLEAQKAKLIYLLKHPPNFHLDCISFVNSVTREGFEQFEDHLDTAIKRLPEVKLQDKWNKTVTWLLSQNEHKPYITLAELQPE